MLVVLVSVNLTAYFGRGPLFPSIHGFEPEGCSKYWWTSLLYVNNLVKPQEMCLGVTWYLANDMQFHWIAPLALVPFALKRKRISFLVISLFTLISTICTAAILIANPKMGTGISAFSVSHSDIYKCPRNTYRRADICKVFY
jgi:peptidoglycan/LPS O-acetylase OafA/YrhL